MAAVSVRFERDADAIGLELDGAFAVTPCWVLHRARLKERAVVAMEFLPAVVSTDQNPQHLSIRPQASDVSSRLERKLEEGRRAAYEALANEMWGEGWAELANDFPEAIFLGVLALPGTIWAILELDPHMLVGEVPTEPLSGAELERIARLLVDVLATRHARGQLHLDVSPDRIGSALEEIDPLGPPCAILRNQAGTGVGQGLLARPQTAPPELLDLSRRAPIGTWTDIYQASATLFWLATGRPRPSWSTGQAEVRRLLDQIETLNDHRALKEMITNGLAPPIALRPKKAIRWGRNLPGQPAEVAARDGIADEPQPAAASTLTLARDESPSLLARLGAQPTLGAAAGIIAGSWPLWVGKIATPYGLLYLSGIPVMFWLGQAIMIALIGGRRPLGFMGSLRIGLPLTSYATFFWHNEIDFPSLWNMVWFGPHPRIDLLFIAPAVLQILAFMPRFRWSAFALACMLAAASALPGAIFPYSPDEMADATTTSPPTTAPKLNDAVMAPADAASSAATEATSIAATEFDWTSVVGRWRERDAKDCSKPMVIDATHTAVLPTGTTMWFEEPTVSGTDGLLEARLTQIAAKGKNPSTVDAKYTFQLSGDGQLTLSNVDGSRPVSSEFVSCDTPDR